jgi:phosphohistidine phosphatase SixA
MRMNARPARRRPPASQQPRQPIVALLLIMLCCVLALGAAGAAAGPAAGAAEGTGAPTTMPSAATEAVAGSAAVAANRADGNARQTPPRILLVRHGETVEDGSRDPELSEAGRARAERLARLLADAGVTRVLSTNYKRTQGTAAPLSRAAGVQIESYDPTDLPALAGRLKGGSGVILVVGHSNTTPQLVGALGGNAHGEIAETEHDRLYVLVPAAEGTVATLLLRY